MKTLNIELTDDEFTTLILMAQDEHRAFNGTIPKGPQAPPDRELERRALLLEKLQRCNICLYNGPV